jgi:tyrosine-protein phosphatase YwqE
MLKALVIMTSLIKATCLLLHIIEGGTYKFTAYDLRNFSHKGVPFKDSFQVERQSYVAETFTITKKSTALLVDDEKVYPPFCYKN